MANKIIGDYTAAITIDGSTDYLLIQPTSSATQYKKINRDTLLGITAQPVGTTSSQTLSNKTLGITNTVTLYDSLFTIQDNADPTKQATFQASGITAGQTRVMTLPDASTTLVGTGATQTLTNKTLTSPVITGGSISNSTVAVDAIAEYTAANGVTIDGLNIKDSALTTANSVPNSTLSNTGTFGSAWAWVSWIPVFVNLSGGAITYAKYTQIGKTIHFRMKYTLAGAGVAGSVTMTLPANFNSDLTTIGDSFNGTVQLGDTGTAQYLGAARWATSSTITILSISTAGIHTALSSTVPHTWANTDTIFVAGSYETT